MFFNISNFINEIIKLEAQIIEMKFNENNTIVFIEIEPWKCCWYFFIKILMSPLYWCLKLLIISRHYNTRKAFAPIRRKISIICQNTMKWNIQRLNDSQMIPFREHTNLFWHKKCKLFCYGHYYLTLLKSSLLKSQNHMVKLIKFCFIKVWSSGDEHFKVY